MDTVKKLDIAQMEKLGVADYYLELRKYILNFIDKNYPLSKDDLRVLANGEQTYNTNLRNRVKEFMDLSLRKIISYQINMNMKYMRALQSGQSVTPITIEQYKQQIFNYKQQILSDLYSFKVKNGILTSRTINQNMESLREAINNGISPEAIRGTFENVLDKSEKTNTPKQLSKMVSAIKGMKVSNGDKLRDALNYGITSNEVYRALNNSTNKAIDIEDKKHLNFVVRLISGIKSRELKMQKNNDISKQRQYIKQ